MDRLVWVSAAFAQASYLKTLCEEAGETFDPGLTKAEASKLIDTLQSRTGRGRTH